ncbi:MAG: PAS domain-containing protein [Chitinophagaceae bacterium]|nr:PAS domain-containing protein [Chitinophagaceae bacterium]
MSIEGAIVLDTKKYEGKNRTSRSKKQSQNLVAAHADDKQSQDHDGLIVGIGASAGGLQAMLKLFDNIPELTGLTFVVIQHLDANNASALADFLSKVTAMPVSEVKDNTVALPNHVYVIAPGTELTISCGVLTVTSQNNGVKRFTPIDTFLESLALDKGSLAIGVVLSGTGADGSRGLKEIRLVGGINFAQEPQSAEYDEMPRSAIATGIVDFVLPPSQIASELSRISQTGIITGPATEVSELFPDGAEALDRIFALLHKASGINFAEYKQLAVKRRMVRRMALLKIDKLDEYALYLRQNNAELIALKQDMLINVTRFFREPEAFDNLKKVVFPSIIGASTANAPIRLWVAGCSTGEEAYSLAIILLEFLEENAIDRPIHIFATDINDTVIEKARIGIYPKSILADVSMVRLSRFFVEVEQGYRVRKEIREICVFAKQDIGQDPPISRVDLLSCRNVMIYFGHALHKRLFPIFHYALKPQGFLFLGASESIGVSADLFDVVDKNHRIYRKKTANSLLMLDVVAAEHAASASKTSVDAPDDFSGITWFDVQKEADRIVVSKYAPPGVIINSKLDIVQFRGRTGVYLEPASGMPSVNLLKMARNGLFSGLRAAVNQAKEENVIVRREDLRILNNGHSHQVNVDVVPISGPFHKSEYFLVLFQDSASPELPASVPAGSASTTQDFYDAAAVTEIMHLKQEVAATKEYLQSIIDQHEAINEDLRYANEEMLSSNEEMQSMNEEMATAKEELQSSNEELMTLNEELGNRITELSHVNDDMTNLLRSINLPVLILNKDLRIRRFNSIAKKIFNLIGADVGQSIRNIKPNIDSLDLEQASQEVIETLNTKEQEVQDRWGHWYSMQIRPFRTIENTIDGVIITFADIDFIKKNLQIAQEAQEYAEAIVETVRQPLLILDTDLRPKTANKAFYTIFQLTPNEMADQSIFQIKEGLWDLPTLRTLLDDILNKGATFEDFEFSYDLADAGTKHMLINARLIINPHNKAKLILIALEPLLKG